MGKQQKLSKPQQTDLKEDINSNAIIIDVFNTTITT